MFVKMETNFSDSLKGAICLRIIFSGCKRAAAGHPCKNCHNPHLWNFNYSEVFNPDKQLQEWKSSGAEFDFISILGGEPLDQARKDLELFVSKVRQYYPDLPVVVYTGYEKEQAFRIAPWLPEFADYLKSGEYREEIERADCGNGPELASGNQRFEKIGDK